MRIREISESWGFTDSKVLPSSVPNQPGLTALSMQERYRANKITRDRKELPEKIGINAWYRGNTAAAGVLCEAGTARGTLLSDDVNRDRG